MVPALLRALGAAGGVSALLAAGPTAVPPAQSTCSIQLAAPMLFPLGSIPGGVVIDSACQFVYVTNTLLNRVEVIALASLTKLEPIQVGAQPVGLDISPDDQRLYVANSGGNNLSVISLARRTEVERIRMPYSATDNNRPFSIVILGNGRAFYTTTFNGSGYGGRIMELDLATHQSTLRSDVFPNGATLERVYLRRSHDRSAFVKLDSAFLQVYRTATNSFSPHRSVSLNDIASNGDATRFFTVQSGLVLDAGLNQIGTIANGAGSKGAAVDAAGVRAYRSIESRVEFLNLVTFLETGEVALGDSVTGTSAFANAGQMAISADGTLLAVTTTTGVVLLKPPPG